MVIMTEYRLLKRNFCELESKVIATVDTVEDERLIIQKKDSFGWYHDVIDLLCEVQK